MTILSVLAAVAAVAWVAAVLAALRLLRYRRPDRGHGWYAVHGHAFFSAGNFTSDGRPAHRLFLLSAAAFFLAILALVGTALVSAR